METELDVQRQTRIDSLRKRKRSYKDISGFTENSKPKGKSDRSERTSNKVKPDFLKSEISSKLQASSTMTLLTLSDSSFPSSSSPASSVCSEFSDSSLLSPPLPLSPASSTSSSITAAGSDKKKSKSGKKSTYKHVPHCLKPPHLVAKRNARERRRVQAVNSAFTRLRKHVPYEPRSKRLSKVKTLRFAIEYIHRLQDLIYAHDRKMSAERRAIVANESCQYFQSVHVNKNAENPDGNFLNDNGNNNCISNNGLAFQYQCSQQTCDPVFDSGSVNLEHRHTRCRDHGPMGIYQPTAYFSESFNGPENNSTQNLDNGRCLQNAPCSGHFLSTQAVSPIGNPSHHYLTPQYSPVCHYPPTSYGEIADTVPCSAVVKNLRFHPNSFHSNYDMASQNVATYQNATSSSFADQQFYKSPDISQSVVRPDNGHSFEYSNRYCPISTSGLDPPTSEICHDQTFLFKDPPTIDGTKDYSIGHNQHSAAFQQHSPSEGIEIHSLSSDIQEPPSVSIQQHSPSTGTQQHSPTVGIRQHSRQPPQTTRPHSQNSEISQHREKQFTTSVDLKRNLSVETSKNSLNSNSPASEELSCALKETSCILKDAAYITMSSYNNLADTLMAGDSLRSRQDTIQYIN